MWPILQMKITYNQKLRDANVIGLELETRTALSFINDKLFVNFNGSVIESQVNITGDEYESRKNNLRDGEEFE